MADVARLRHDLMADLMALFFQISMGDLQDPTDGGTLVPYVWPYFVGIFTYIGLIYIGLIYGRYLQ